VQALFRRAGGVREGPAQLSVPRGAARGQLRDRGGQRQQPAGAVGQRHGVRRHARREVHRAAPRLVRRAVASALRRRVHGQRLRQGLPHQVTERVARRPRAAPERRTKTDLLNYCISRTN